MLYVDISVISGVKKSRLARDSAPQQLVVTISLFKFVVAKQSGTAIPESFIPDAVVLPFEAQRVTKIAYWGAEHRAVFFLVFGQHIQLNLKQCQLFFSFDIPGALLYPVIEKLFGNLVHNRISVEETNPEFPVLHLSLIHISEPTRLID